jgi:hypothetical protein
VGRGTGAGTGGVFPPGGGSIAALPGAGSPPFPPFALRCALRAASRRRAVGGGPAQGVGRRGRGSGSGTGTGDPGPQGALPGLGPLGPPAAPCAMYEKSCSEALRPPMLKTQRLASRKPWVNWCCLCPSYRINGCAVGGCRWPIECRLVASSSGGFDSSRLAPSRCKPDVKKEIQFCRRTSFGSRISQNTSTRNVHPTDHDISDNVNYQSCFSFWSHAPPGESRNGEKGGKKKKRYLRRRWEISCAWREFLRGVVVRGGWGVGGGGGGGGVGGGARTVWLAPYCLTPILSLHIHPATTSDPVRWRGSSIEHLCSAVCWAWGRPAPFRHAPATTPSPSEPGPPLHLRPLGRCSSGARGTTAVRSGALQPHVNGLIDTTFGCYPSSKAADDMPKGAPSVVAHNITLLMPLKCCNFRPTGPFGMRR